MSKIKTFRGQLPIGEQKRINLSTNDGLTGYRINKFQIVNKTPGAQTVSLVAKIYTTDQTGKITSTVDFNESDLLAAHFYSDNAGSQNGFIDGPIIFDKEMINQDIFIYIADSDGNADPGNYYLELEQFKININESTVTTLKNLRSNQQL